VIDTGDKKIVYVERSPGRFEGVEVQLGPRNGEFYPVLKGLKEGDKVAAAGGFLIDAETRLNPAAASIYSAIGPQASGTSATHSAPSQGQGDKAPASPAKPDKPDAKPESAKPEPEPRVAADAPDPEDLKNIRQLPKEDQSLALAQRICPVTEAPLGSMGVPIKVPLPTRGTSLFVCCSSCIGKVKQHPDEMLKKIEDAKAAASK
jgi:Cu(I)/Ag(I) efflux system membrane fusion protein